MSKIENIDLTSGDESSTKSSTPQTEKHIPLYDKYEDKTEEVKKQFVVLKQNQYIGNLKNVYSASDEFMTCDCEEIIENDVNVACGADSDCINRLTNIECVNEQCGCGDNCLNQRFQRCEYADISIFLTENKGFGVRANVDIPANTFIIEYIGDVVDGEEYKIRKEKYNLESISHFYFMMIQDNEIIDATKRASLARYCNHSCNPNAYIEKWVVNKRFRMGIFAKRKIFKGEEICFDYNVDRYGAEPQKCYCGSSNCLGVMGGKTQSETVRLLPHVITEALGVRASDEKKWIKEQKKNGIKITNDNVDSNVNVEFVKSLELRPLDLFDVAKVSSCLMQPDLDLIVIDRILERFTIKSDQTLENLLIRLNRLHGIRALGKALKTLIIEIGNKKHITNEEKSVLNEILHLFWNWPKLRSKNSIQDNEIEYSLNKLRDLNISNDFNQRIESLINKWKNLEIVYKIPKKNESSSTKTVLDDRRYRENVENDKLQPIKLPTAPASLIKPPWGDLDTSILPENRKLNGQPLPLGWEWALDPESKNIYYFNRIMNLTQWDKPEWPSMEDEEKRKRKERDREREKARELRELEILEKERALKKQTELREEEEKLNILSNIIAQATKSNEGKSNGSKSILKSIPKGPAGKTAKFASVQKVNIKLDKNTELKNNKFIKNIEKQWMALFASYVPNILKRYESEIGRDNLKHCARDIVHLLTDKQTKRHADAPVPKVLSDERKIKIKAFSKSYMAKFLQKFEEKKRRKNSENHEEVIDSQKRQKV